MIKQISQLQEIEDVYVKKSFRGKELKEVLTKDKNYQRILAQKRKKLTPQILITNGEKENYALSTDPDYKILQQCKLLEQQKLKYHDRTLVL